MGHAFFVSAQITTLTNVINFPIHVTFITVCLKDICVLTVFSQAINLMLVRNLNSAHFVMTLENTVKLFVKEIFINI